jgi:ABC-type branched-subunit amino acid transport system ATPase component
MMVDAKIVFLDEVGAGVNRTLLKTIGTSIQRLNEERGYTFCMIEHDMDFIARLCDPVIVMAEGKLLTQGTVDEVKSNEEVIEAYLGTGRKRARGGSMKFLSATGMTGGYGGADIIEDCDITVEKGEIAVVVGPNGAGKSTAMKAVFGMLDLREGSVVLDGQDITNMAPQDRVRIGMAFVPQNRNVFVSMTVEENLEMGAFIRDDDIRHHGAGVSPVSGAQGEAQPAGRRAVRRPAPAGRGGPGPDD